MYLCQYTSFYSFTIISVTLDCSDVSMFFFTHISYIFWVYTSHFVSGFIICVQCKAFVFMCNARLQFCFILLKVYFDWNMQTIGTVLCISFFLAMQRTFPFSALCCNLCCIMAVVVKFSIEHFFLLPFLSQAYVYIWQPSLGSICACRT